MVLEGLAPELKEKALKPNLNPFKEWFDRKLGGWFCAQGTPGFVQAAEALHYMLGTCLESRTPASDGASRFQPHTTSSIRHTSG